MGGKPLGRIISFMGYPKFAMAAARYNDDGDPRIFTGRGKIRRKRWLKNVGYNMVALLRYPDIFFSRFTFLARRAVGPQQDFTRQRTLAGCCLGIQKNERYKPNSFFHDVER